MPRIRDLLYRFRPAGAPGSAADAGVPADRERDLAEELEPVFVALSPTLAECEAIVEDGRRGADAIRIRDAAEVRRVLASAEQRAATERARAATEVEATAAPDAARFETESLAQLEALRERVERAMPEYRRRVAASVETLLGDAT